MGNKQRPAGILDIGYNENTSPIPTNALMRDYTHNVVLDVALHAKGFYQTNWGEVLTPEVLNLIEFRPPSVITTGV